MRYAAQHGKALGNTLQAIRNRQPFDAGNLRGTTYVLSYGVLPDNWRADLRERERHISYVVYSYATPIAWYDTERGEWTVPNVKYSITTSAHQANVDSALRWLTTPNPDSWRGYEIDYDSAHTDANLLRTARSVTLASLRRAQEVFS